jgi:hypothetical protein
MHDVDRTQLETGFGGEYGYELEPEYEYGGGNGAPREADEMELASELLEVGSEEELDEFLGSIISSATKAAGDFLRSGAGQAVTGIVKDVARKALPSIGRSIGGIFGSQGGDIGAQLATRAGSMFGLELEGLSPQDQEFEVARQVVRFTQKAAEEAEKVAGTAPPQQAAQQAVQRAAQRYAPGILQLLRGGGGPWQSTPRPRGPDRGRGIVPPQQLQAIFTAQPQESPLSEVEEMELAGDLLGVSSEAELDEFLGDLVKKAASAVGGFVRSPVGRQIGGILKGVAKQALPALGAGAAGFFGLPPQLGGAAGSMIANTFELETDGMASEELEFEVARKIVALGATAASNAAAAPPNVPAKQVAQAAVQAAAQRYAPGLARQQGGGGENGEGGTRSGRWVRRGRKIVLYGV